MLYAAKPYCRAPVHRYHGHRRPDVAQAIRFIRENTHRGIQVAHVVAETGLSRRTLERRFRRCLNRPLKAEILRVRIENAKRLLMQTTLAIESVGKRCGFGVFKYFGQVFRRETGVTPRAFRKRGGFADGDSESASPRRGRRRT